MAFVSYSLFNDQTHWLDAIVFNLLGHDLVLPNGDNVWTPKVTRVRQDKSVTEGL